MFETGTGAANRSSESGLKAFFLKHWHVFMDIYLCVNVAVWVAWRLYKTWTAGNLGYVETAFAIQNLVFLAVILIRRAHRSVDRNIFHQMIALGAFFSGLAFMGQPPSGGPTALAVSKGIIFFSHILSAVCLATLGRGFGILIALRVVRTRGVYGFVRHPMYAADILLRAGYVVSHLNLLTAVLFVVSSACYVYRAILEERFLKQTREYREYMKKVRYRFIPFVF